MNEPLIEHWERVLETAEKMTARALRELGRLTIENMDDEEE